MASCPLARDLHALLAHDAPHDLLGDHDGLLEFPELVGHAAVAARPAGALEDIRYLRVQLGILVRPGKRRTLVLIGALRYSQGSGEVFQGVAGRLPQMLYDQGFLPVRQRIEACGFKTSTTPRRMSFSSSSCLMRSSGVPSNPDQACSLPSGTVDLAGMEGSSLSADLAQLYTVAALSIPSAFATSFPSIPPCTSLTASAFVSGLLVAEGTAGSPHMRSIALPDPGIHGLPAGISELTDCEGYLPATPLEDFERSLLLLWRKAHCGLLTGPYLVQLFVRTPSI